MLYRTFGRTGWQVSEIGYGMWGMGEWTESDDAESLRSLQLAVELGCNFFDTAWAYGSGHSETLFRELARAHPNDKLYIATKIPPKNRKWPSRRGSPLAEVFPADYINEYTERSLKNLGVETIDLQQFHVWEDAWANMDEWQHAIEDLKQAGKIQAVGISINRWEPWNGVETVRTGKMDAVQVIYNVFDQNPEDALFPACDEFGVGVIARVPFDEGSLTGTLTLDSKWAHGDWRNGYFVPENLRASVEHADALKPLVPEKMTMPEMALRWILANKTVSTIIPGMRREANVRANIAASDGMLLDDALMGELRKHRWERIPTEWSQ
jgi:aryl-alcohol dehydrogenase-like predicted oxidoreductase